MSTVFAHTVDVFSYGPDDAQRHGWQCECCDAGDVGLAHASEAVTLSSNHRETNWGPRR